MSKQYTVHLPEDLAPLKAILTSSAERTRSKIHAISSVPDPLILLSEFKYNDTGCDPLDPERDLNLIEQVNQTFTYWATFEAVEYLFKKHPSIKSLTLNLGTQGGSDIGSADDGGIAAEVFATTSPQSNDKLRKDVKKVSGSTAKYKYVFFSCPDYPSGIEKSDYRYPDVKIVSVGIYEGSQPIKRI